MTDLIAGQVEMGVVALNAVAPHLKNGALRAIGLCATRSPAAPDIPTIAEQGLPTTRSRAGLPWGGGRAAAGRGKASQHGVHQGIYQPGRAGSDEEAG